MAIFRQMLETIVLKMMPLSIDTANLLSDLVRKQAEGIISCQKRSLLKKRRLLKQNQKQV
jgi:hypothetical protein